MRSFKRNGASFYLAIELTLKKISRARFVSARANVHAMMTQKLCAVGMRNAKLGNHLKVLLHDRMLRKIVA